MSINAMNVVWMYYPEGGPMLVLALALADEADDYGGGISASVPALARKTRQSERAVQKQLRRLADANVLDWLNQGGVGRGDVRSYKLNLGLLMAPEKGEHGSPICDLRRVNAVHPFDAGKGERGSPFSGPHYKSSIKDTTSSADEGVAAFTLSAGTDQDEDRRLAEWMLAQIRRLNPNHREPSWPAWCKDLRRLRVIDKRTRREVAELFAWASEDTFWQQNILSPAALRKQWDRLVIKRSRGNGAAAPTSAAPDTRCAWERGGERCTAQGAFGDPDGRWWCRAHDEERERNHDARAG